MIKKQYVVALSSCEAIWLRNLLEQLNHPQEDSTPIYVDNKSAIELAKNPVQHGRSKHIDIKYHFLGDHLKQRTVKLEYCNTKEQMADIFTKALPTDTFIKLRTMLGMKKFLV